VVVDVDKYMQPKTLNKIGDEKTKEV
jgi:hypothetical protein